MNETELFQCLAAAALCIGVAATLDAIVFWIDTRILHRGFCRPPCRSAHRRRA